MNTLPIQTINLNNTPWYTAPKNQHEVWRQTKTNVEESGLSHEKYLEAVNFMVIQAAPKVFMPLHGDIEGVQHYLIAENFYLFERRWFSYYLRADDNGKQKHAPTRLTERVRESHLVNLLIGELKQHFAVERVDALFEILFPKSSCHLFDNAKKQRR